MATAAVGPAIGHMSDGCVTIYITNIYGAHGTVCGRME